MRKLTILAALMVIIGPPALGQTTTKLCVPVPPIPGQLGAPSCADVSMTNALPVKTGTTSVTLMPLDVSTVTSAGVPVVALVSGHHLQGGIIQNPPTAKTLLCINEIGAAKTTGGNNICLRPGAVQPLSASGGPVSVVSSDANHPFSGYGWN